MADGPVTPERILEASEDVLRRYGPAKATVVDVARELGVSHGSVYRRFPTKTALRDAVGERWLATVSERPASRERSQIPAGSCRRFTLDAVVSAAALRALVPDGSPGRVSVAYAARNDLPIMGTETNDVWLSRMSGVRRCGPGRQAGGRRA